MCKYSTTIAKGLVISFVASIDMNTPTTELYATDPERIEEWISRIREMSAHCYSNPHLLVLPHHLVPLCQNHLCIIYRMPTSSNNVGHFIFVSETSFTVPQELHLPSCVNVARDEEKMAIAYAWEERNTILAQADLDARRLSSNAFRHSTLCIARAQRLLWHSRAAQRVELLISELQDGNEKKSSTDNPPTTGSLFPP